MALTFTELLERLKKVDEISLLEILDISSEDLVDRFPDLIQYKYDEIVQEFPDDETEKSD